MNVMHHKKKSASAPVPLTLLMLIQKVFAYIWLVIALLVVIIGAIVVIMLVHTIKHVLPDPAPPEKKENVTRIWLEDEKGNDIFWVYDDVPGGQNNPAGLTTLDSGTIGTTSFSFQYRIDSIDANGPVAKIYYGSDPSPLFIGDVVGVVNDYTFQMCANGKVFQITCLNGVYTTQVLLNDTNIYTVVIERTTDLVNWSQVFTNVGCALYTVEYYVDREAPIDKAFYRLNISHN